MQWKVLNWFGCGYFEYQSKWFGLTEALDETSIETDEIALIFLSFIHYLLLTLSKLTPQRAQLHKFHYSWPATIMRGELSWVFQSHLPYLWLSFLMIWLLILSIEGHLLRIIGFKVVNQEFLSPGLSIKSSQFQSRQPKVTLTRIIYREFSILESSIKSHLNQNHLSRVLNFGVVSQESP